MTFNREEAFSFLNRLISESTPVLVFWVSRSGVSVLVCSMVHLDPEYLTLKAEPNGLPTIWVNVGESVRFEYGDARELTRRIPKVSLEQPEIAAQAKYLESLIAGGIAIMTDADGTVGLIEFNLDAIRPPA